MQSDDQQRRKTRSQLVEDEREVSRPQIPSLSNIDMGTGNYQMESNKVKEQRQQPTRKSNWNKKEKVKYLVFLNYYSQVPHWSSDLKSIPTYKALSLFVKSRSPEQCKSFHLSTRRNYKSVEEEIKALQEELQVEQGYQKMLDKYELEIIAFEQEQKMLEKFELQEKKYFRDKLLQKCKETGFNKEIVGSGESPQEPEYNPKFNINQLIQEKQLQELRKEEQNPPKEQYQPFINPQYNNAQKGEIFMSVNMTQPNTSMPNMIPSSSQHGKIGAYGQPNASISDERIKANEKYPIEGIRQNEGRIPSFDNRMIPYTNERIMQQNYNRMIEANKQMFGQYGSYGNYGPSAFGGMNQMQMAQFRNQLPYTMPPPGGIPFMMHSYSDAYRMGGIQAQRYGPGSENQNVANKQKGTESKNMPGSVQNNKEKSNQQKSVQEYSQKKKQLLLSCHQHYVNWFRAVNQLNRRKQTGNSITVNNKAQ